MLHCVLLCFRMNPVSSKCHKDIFHECYNVSIDVVHKLILKLLDGLGTYESSGCAGLGVASFNMCWL